MLGQMLKRGGLLALVAFMGIFTASSAKAQIVESTLRGQKGNFSVYGGSDAEDFVTVALASPAETGGHAVHLHSNDPALVLTDTDVVVPEGEDYWEFQVVRTPYAVPSTVFATVTVSDEASSVGSASLELKPMDARFVTGPAGLLQQGGTYTFSVKLSARVALDQTVDITSNNPGVVASDAYIVAGTNSATFTVVVSPTATGTSTLTASFNGIDHDGPERSITKISLTSVTAASATIPKGQNMSVTVNLSTVAVGPHAINITYTGPVPAGAPTSVIVPDGQSSVTFNVPNNWTRGGATVSVTAAYGTVTRFVKFNVTP